MQRLSDFTSYIIDMLSPLGAVTATRMFSGVLLKLEGKQIGVVWGDSFYFRVPVPLHNKFIEHGSIPFRYMKKSGEVVMKAYWSCPEELIDNRELFLEWAEEITELS